LTGQQAFKAGKASHATARPSFRNGKLYQLHGYCLAVAETEERALSGESSHTYHPLVLEVL
jgi:hypothetical protein